MNEYEVYKAAIKQWGEESQIMTFFEEVGELMTAISQYKRGRIPIENVLEELVDVHIMVEQLRIIFDPDPEQETTGNIYAKKFWRLRDKLQLKGN